LKIDKKKFFIFLAVFTTIILFGILVNTTFAADSSFDPMTYDTDNDNTIQINEVAHATNDYNWNEISKEEVIEVYKYYFGVK
jgi:hypothetical protein